MQNEDKNIEIIRQYKVLLDAGAITQEEFDKKKAEILSNGNKRQSTQQPYSYAPLYPALAHLSEKPDMRYAHFIALGLVFLVLAFIAFGASGTGAGIISFIAAAVAIIYGLTIKNGRYLDGDILLSSFKHIFTSTGYLITIIVLTLIVASAFFNDDTSNSTDMTRLWKLLES